MKIKDFQGLNKFKLMKKGIYFAIDSILAGALILFVIVFASSFYVKEQPIFHINYLSQDLINTLSTITVSEIDNDYLNGLISSGDIENIDNTILEQIGEFWAGGELVLANKTTMNVTESLMPNSTGFGIWMDNETIYTRDIPLKKSLISSKKLISGISKGQTSGPNRKNPPTLWGPVVAEVRVWQ